jgi:hypothetical protein
MIKEISANARVSFKQITKSGDVFYTFEYGQVRTVDESNLVEENQKLWDAVNTEVNNQIIEVKKLYTK